MARARTLVVLAGLGMALALAGCTNPEFSYDVDNGACPDEGTTAPVPGDEGECPVGDDVNDNRSDNETTLEDV